MNRWLPLALASSLRLLSLALFLFDLLRRLDLLTGVEPGRPVDWEHIRGFHKWDAQNGGFLEENPTNMDDLGVPKNPTNMDDLGVP